MTPLVVLDADVLGRERTGDETHVENLLRCLPEAAGGSLRFAAVTRRPDLVPDGIVPDSLAIVTPPPVPAMLFVAPLKLYVPELPLMLMPVLVALV